MDETFLKLLTALLKGGESSGSGVRALTDQKRLDYLNGEQFGTGGQYWMGRASEKTEVMGEIAKTFVCDNRINGCINRHVSAIFGKDPEFDLVIGDNPYTGEEVQALTDWWSTANIHSTIKDLLIKSVALGRGSLRVTIPAKFQQQVAAATDYPTVLKYVRVQALPATQAGPVVDEWGDTLGYFFAYDVQDGQNKKRLVEVHTPEQVATYEVQSDKPGTAVIPAAPNPLLPYEDFLIRQFNRSGGPLIDQSVIDLQNGLNEEWTYMRRDSKLAGFRTVWVTNSQPPKDADNKPVPWDFSPANVLHIQGLPIKEKSNMAPEPITVGHENPGVGVLLPVDPSVFFLPKIKEFKSAIEDKFNQTWVDAAAKAISGESKIESRKAFDLGVISDGNMASMAVKWLVETVLRVAASLLGRTLTEGLTVRPKLFLDVKTKSLDVFAALVTARASGCVSLETVIEANPAVSDPAVEKTRLEAEQAAKQAEQTPDTQPQPTAEGTPPAGA